MRTYLLPGLPGRLQALHILSSDQELASIIGCSTTELGRLVRHEQAMSIEQIVRISLSFGLPFSEITSERTTSEHNKEVHDAGRGG